MLRNRAWSRRTETGFEQFLNGDQVASVPGNLDDELLQQQIYADDFADSLLEPHPAVAARQSLLHLDIDFVFVPQTALELATLTRDLAWIESLFLLLGHAHRDRL
jgi:GAF domain-containing protein